MNTLPPLNRTTPSGRKIVGDYIIGRTLGEGSFGKVKMGVHIETKKFIRFNVASEREKLCIQREHTIMELVEHPHIVNMFEVFEIPEKQTTCLVLEYVEGGELFDYIVANGRLDEKEAIRIFRQIISAVEYLHSNLIVHRENILLDANLDVKVNDFGLSNVMKIGNFLHSRCGSPHYSPPEVMSEKSYIGPEIDVWALGVVLFAMVTGLLPWGGQTVQEQLKNALEGKFFIPAHVSKPCKELICRMLCVDPKDRATIAEIREHSWVNLGYDSPPHSSLPPRKAVQSPDPFLLEALVTMGFDAKQVKEDLKKNATKSQHVVLYHLMNDFREREEEIAANGSPKIECLHQRMEKNNSVRKSIAKFNGQIPKTDSVADTRRSSWPPIETSESPEISPIPAKSSLIPRFFRRNKNREMTIEREEEIVAKMEKGMRKANLKSLVVTSSRGVPEMKERLEEILRENSIEWKTKKKGLVYSCKPKHSKVKFDIEICKVQEHEEKRGVTLKRSGGQFDEYKSIHQKLHDNLVAVF